MNTKSCPRRTKLHIAVFILALGMAHAFADSALPPNGVSTSDWAGIRAARESARHEVRPEADGALVAENPGQQWRIRFDGRGFMIHRAAGGVPWGLELRGYGFPGAEHAVGGKADVSHRQGKVHYDWDDTLQEWFINDRRGLEQGWTFHQRPAGGENGGPLRLALALRGELRAAVLPTGDGVHFTDATGAAALTYGGLKAWDADGKPLAVRFETGDSGSFHVAVEERGARYPVTVDPTVQEAVLRASNAEEGDRFGLDAVAISGDTVVVGAPDEDSNATGVNGNQNDNSIQSNGAAYIFVRNGPSWSQQAYLKPNGGNLHGVNGVGFGRAVAISGNTVVVGAIGDYSIATGVNGNPNTIGDGNGGAAYVFVRNGTVWTQQSYLKSDGVKVGGNFGQSVAISGGTILVGREINNLTGGAGEVHVFVRDGSTWTQQARIEHPDPDLSSSFGYSVALSGNTAVIGAPNDPDTTVLPGMPNYGAAYVWVRNGTSWSQQARLVSSLPVSFGKFGYSVAVSGDSVIVGEPKFFGFEPGAAYVFTRGGTTWSQQARFTATNLTTLFGTSVAIEDERAVVTDPSDPSNSTEVDGDPNDVGAVAVNPGAAYLFSRVGSTWTQESYLKAPAGGRGIGFGVGMSGGIIVTGNYYSGGNAEVECVNVFEASGGQIVRDVNSRSGKPGVVLPYADVTLVSGEDVLATTVTDIAGHFVFPEPAPDMTQPHDVWLEQSYFDTDGVEYTVQRMYDSARILGPTSVTLALPVELHNELETSFRILENAGPLNLGYDLATARALMDDWNSIDLRSASEHTARDMAMVRLLNATNGMAKSYDAAESVAMDGAKLMANTVITFLSAIEVLQEVNKGARHSVDAMLAENTVEEAFAVVFMEVISAGVATAKAGLEVAKDDFVDGLKGSLSEPWRTGVDLTLTTAIGGLSESVSSGSWDRAKLKSGGTDELLEALFEKVAEQVGGRLLALGYVAANQPHLNTAVTRTINRDGDGTVIQGFTASVNKVTEIENKAADALSASKTASDIAKGWGQVADVAQAGGNIPGLQVAKTCALVVQALNVGLVAGATVNDFVKLNEITFTDTPQVPLLAIFPSGVPSSPAAVQTEAIAMETMAAALPEDGVVAQGSVLTANALPSDYETALTALRARIVSGDRTGAQADIEAVLSAHQTLVASLQSSLLGAKTKATTASPARPALNTAVTNLSQAAGNLHERSSVMYFDIAGWMLPEIADPAMTQSGLLSKIDAVLAAIAFFNQALAAVETEAAGLVAPAHLMTTEHGVTGASISGNIQPGTAELTAHVVNTGNETATGFTAQLTPIDPTEPVAVLQVNGASTLVVPDLAPGESHTVTWNVLLTDISANGTGSGTSYTISLAGAGGTTHVVSGGIRVITSLNTEPLLTLKGSNPLILDARASYTDAGATAYDFEEGSLTPVMVGNNVVPNLPGNYTVSFSATDSTGLTSTVTRNVQVIASALPALSAPAGGFSPLSLPAGSPLPDYATMAVASDNSGTVTVTQIPVPGTVVSEGTLTVTITASDGAGNQASLSFDVIVTAAAADGIFSDDWPLTPRDMEWHNDLTLHPGNGWLYGTCQSGGLFNKGMIFRVNAAGGYQTLVHFTNGDYPFDIGGAPAGRLVLGSDGNFYGTTSSGGTHGDGTVFKMTPEGELTTLASFGFHPGSSPYGGLVEGSDGNFYGTTAFGGASGFGTIFKVTPQGGFTSLLSFTGNGATNKGRSPNGALVLGADGEFYGTTSQGGALNFGTIFKVTSEGVLTTLVEFTSNGESNRGSEPYGSLIIGPDGDFYGMTNYGGASSCGTVFKMTAAGALTTLVDFTNNGPTNAGGFPYGDLVLGADSLFYGMTSEGGTNGFGTIFKMTPAGELTTLVEFTENGAGNRGSEPYGSLTIGPDGNFYGTTSRGGAFDAGTVFRLTPTGELTTLIESTNMMSEGATDRGAFPHGGLATGSDGFLYGTTEAGGTHNQGTLFRLNSGGGRTTLLSFTGNDAPHKGGQPQSGLTLGPDGNLYGVTKSGGIGYGTLFRVTPEGVLSTLVEFDFNGTTNKGAFPVGRLVLGADGLFYGSTQAGGVNGLGTLFKVTTAGVLTTLVEFTGNGASNAGHSPEGGLILAPDGDFYGMTYGGGTSGGGTIFKMNSAGILTTLVHLDNVTGTRPKGLLSLGPDGQLYGMMSNGGNNGFGTIIKVSTAGVFTKLIDFGGTSGTHKGAWPTGSLTLASDGNFYGMTDYGGARDLGTLFKMTPDGVFSTLSEFKGSGSGIDSGANPQHSLLVIGEDGKLYGMATKGGRQGGGVVFHLAMPATGPVIAVRGNNVNIANNDSTPSFDDHTRFGLVATASGSSTRTFTIHNTGAGDLTIGSVIVSGAHAADFSITTVPAATVPAGESTTLGITFDPASAGVKTAHLSFTTNDSEAGTFGFFISGTGNSAPVVSGQTFSMVRGMERPIPETAVLKFAWDIDGQTLDVADVDASSTEGGAIARGSGTILYTAGTGYTGADSFALAVSDGLVATPGTMTVNVYADSGITSETTPQLTKLAGQGIRLDMTGRPGLTYGILRSTDLAEWIQIATSAAANDGGLEFEDPSPPPHKAFYRIIFPAE